MYIMYITKWSKQSLFLLDQLYGLHSSHCFSSRAEACTTTYALPRLHSSDVPPSVKCRPPATYHLSLYHTLNIFKQSMDRAYDFSIKKNISLRHLWFLHVGIFLLNRAERESNWWYVLQKKLMDSSTSGSKPSAGPTTPPTSSSWFKVCLKSFIEVTEGMWIRCSWRDYLLGLRMHNANNKWKTRSRSVLLAAQLWWNRFWRLCLCVESTFVLDTGGFWKSGIWK